LSEVFGSSASIETVFKGYDEYAKGKKTLIFNPTTKVNKEMYKAFKDKGVNCKMYDSVNKVEGQTRKGVTDWFRDTDDAVLLNVGVFTTGFSINDLEVIIYNKKTKSLSLYLQSIGRGSRILKPEQIKAGKVKDKFIMLDMGLNIAEHGKWSDDRDWSSFFVVDKWKKKKEYDILQFWECSHCGAYNESGVLYNQEKEIIECPACHKPKLDTRKRRLIKGEFVVLEEPIHPSASKILKYVKDNNGDANTALKICKNQIVDLFKYHTDARDFVERRGLYYKRIGELYRPIYFSVMKDPFFKGKHRKLTTELESIYTKVEQLYI